LNVSNATMMARVRRRTIVKCSTRAASRRYCPPRAGRVRPRSCTRQCQSHDGCSDTFRTILVHPGLISVGSELFTIVHKSKGTTEVTH
jgi:hypothetical protein